MIKMTKDIELMDNMIDLFNSQEWGMYELMERMNLKDLKRVYYELLSMVNEEV